MGELPQNSNNIGEPSDHSCPFHAVAKSNFLCDPSSNLCSPSTASTASPLPLLIGDRLRVLATNGQWCWGHRIEGGERQRGLFPKSHIRPIATVKRKNGSAEGDAHQLVAEITKTIKAWWERTKVAYANVNESTSNGACKEHISRIRELMALRRRLRSGKVPTEELREIRQNVARSIDLGNNALGLHMEIRDADGHTINARELSLIAAYRRHEETFAQVTQVSPPQSIASEDGSESAQKWAESSAEQEYGLLVTVEHPQLGHANAELVLGLGRKAGSGGAEGQQQQKGTKPLSEPLAIYLGNAKLPPRQSRVLFLGLSGAEVHNEHGGLSLWVSALRMAPLLVAGTGYGGSAVRGEEVRQFVAHGQTELGQLLAQMADKELCECTIGMVRKSESHPSQQSQFPAGSSAALPYPNGATLQQSTAEKEQRIPLKMSVQLLCGSRAQIVGANPELDSVVALRKMRTAEASKGDGCRNEVFVWLRSADLHGVGKSEKSVEASVSVVDDDGAFQPDAIEIMTPDGAQRQSSFRCRVWPAEDRPRLNELIKVRLPAQEMRNLHLQILFYNKSISEKKPSLPSANMGPFAVAFLRLIQNYVLCAAEEDELLVYKVEKAKNQLLNGGDSARPLSVAYLGQYATKKEMRQMNGVSTARGIGTLTRAESVTSQSSGAAAAAAIGPYTLCDKSTVVHFQTFVASTMHTTSTQLLQLMRWREHEHELGAVLRCFCAVDLNEMSGELLKFLANVLDALFQMAHSIPQVQRPVFDALVHICRHCEECRSTQFRAALEHYIEHMHHATAHTFLLQNVTWYIEHDTEQPSAAVAASINAAVHAPSQPAYRDHLLLVLKSLSPLVRLALASKRCAERIARSEQQLAETKEQFRTRMEQMLEALAQLLQGTTRRMTRQNVALKHLAAVILPLVGDQIFDRLHLAKFVLRVLDSLSEGVLLRQRLHFIAEIVASELFSSVQCRALLMARFLDEMVALMPPHLHEEEKMRKLLRKESISDSASANYSLDAIHLSAKTIADLIDGLFPYHTGESTTRPIEPGTRAEFELILAKCMRPLNQTMVTLLGDPTHQRTLHALLLAILDKCSSEHFSAYFGALPHQLDKLDTLCELLHMFRDLMLRCPVPAEWYQMRTAQLHIFAKNLRFCSALIKRDFGNAEHFDVGVWRECMLTCVCLAKCAMEQVDQREVALEEMVETEGDGEKAAAGSTKNLLSEYAAQMLRSLWFSLQPEAKSDLMPDLAGQVLEMAFAGSRLLGMAIPIFADMLAAEEVLGAAGGGLVRVRVNDQNRRRSNRFSELFIRRLDPLLDDQVQDAASFDAFRATFGPALLAHCARAPDAKEQQPVCHAFVQRVDRLLELFAAYRSLCTSNGGNELAELGMYCTAQLVDFYQSIDQHALYVLYLYKLYNLHITSGNWVEAALVLKRHADLLKWRADDRPAPWLCGTRKQNKECTSQLELKELLYCEMAELFEKGEHWELAIETNEELAGVYRNIVFDYAKLAELLQRSAELYRKLMRKIRLESNYFLVAFHGRDCPPHLVDRKFVFRGRPLEQWGSFKQRVLSALPDFKFLESMERDDAALRSLEGRQVQVVTVAAVPLNEVYAFLLQSPSRIAAWYYRHHRVQRFELVRPEFRPDTKWTRLEDNEATRLWLRKRIVTIQRSLPDLLNFASVVSEHEMDPLNPVEAAIEKVKEANDQLAETATRVAEGFNEFLMNLGGMIRGIVQAAVGGGVRNYQAFFSEECRAQCSEEECRSVAVLRKLILEQISLLEYALFVHASSEQARTNPMFHNSLAGSFVEHKASVEQRLGEAKSMLPPNTSIYVLEPNSTRTGQSAAGNGKENRTSTAQSLSAIATTPKLARNSSLAQSDQPKLAPLCATPVKQQAGNRISSGSNVSTSSSCSATNMLKNSPFGTAHSLIKTTIQCKRQRRAAKATNKSSIAEEPCSTAATVAASLRPELRGAYSQRMSDTSMEFLMESTEPPLPPRCSDRHSKETRKRERRRCEP